MALEIQIFSDMVCPWCYIGKRRLDRALEQFRGSHTSVEWKAFQLNPELPPQGIDRQSYMRKKFGDANMDEMYERLSALGKEDGIEFHFEKIRLSPNTLAAHRLNWFALQQGKQNEVLEGIFAAYFTQGRDIGDVKTLIEIGREAGLDANNLRQFFSSADGTREVQQDIQLAQDRDITLVPYFIFNRDYWITGADTVDTIINALRVAEQNGEDAQAGL